MIKLIKTEIQANNNKWWQADLQGTTVYVSWGRVGDSGQSQVKDFPDVQKAEKFIDKKVKEKEAKGYKKLATLDSQKIPQGLVARRDISQGDKELQDLIDYLVEVNRHTIEASTTIKFNAGTGLFQTPLGIVTQDTIDQARRLLFANASGSPEYWTSELGQRSCADYLMLIPQDVGRRRPDPMNILGTKELIDKQLSILDALEGSLKALNQAPLDDNTPIFKVSLRPSQEAEIRRVEILYMDSRGRHSSGSMRVKRVWDLDIEVMTEAFEQRGRPLGNVRQLWHGTKAGNLLSILKSGLIIPPSGAAHCTGRMYGDGLYFSDQSTKSLNYATGYWGGSRDNRCYMLLNEVAMGKEYIPQGSRRSGIPQGYDSCYAKAGQSGVYNNEMIVYNTYQARPIRLVEFQ